MAQYVFPLGNFILPIVIWSSTKKDSEFADANGKSVINFQLSIFLYSVILALIAIPVAFYTVFKHVGIREFMHREDWYISDFTQSQSIGIVSLVFIAIFLFGLIKVAEFFLIILGAVKASNGEEYRYPFTIKFIK